MMGLGLCLTGLLLVPVFAFAQAEGNAPAAKPAAAAAAPAPAATERSAEEKYPELKEAAERFKQMDFPAALAMIKAACGKYPELSPPQIIMAGLYAQIQRAADARLSLERAVMEDPNDPEAYVLLAELAVNEHRVTEAELLLTKATAAIEGMQKNETRKKAMTFRTLGGLAMVAEAREKWPEAQKRLEAWLAVDARNAAAEARLARAYFSQQKYNEALDHLQKAKQIDPNALTPEAFLARFFASAGDTEKAEHYIGLALKKAPKDFQTVMTAGQLYAETGKLEEAKKYITQALELNPDSLEAKLNRGVVAMFQKDYEAAEQYFEAVLHVTPANFQASNNLAMALCEQPDKTKKQRALEYAQVNVRQFPKQPETYSTLGWVAYKLGRLEDAEQALRTAVSAGTTTPDTVYYLARVLADRDRRVEAKRLLDLVKKSNVNKHWFLRRDADRLYDELQ
jgi:tetratricopeptide (TPR) repeat protein